MHAGAVAGAIAHESSYRSALPISRLVFRRGASYNVTMPKRPEFQREIKRGRICEWPDGVGTPEELAARVTYTGSAIHKSYPSPAGPPALRADKAKCDQYDAEAWPLLLEALGKRLGLGA